MSPHSRYSTSWVSVFGIDKVRAMLIAHKIPINSKLLSFLNHFGDIVETSIESRKRVNAEKLITAKNELKQVLDVAGQEVLEFQQNLLPNHLKQLKKVEVKEDDLTYLPVIFLSLSSLPTLVVRIERSYVRRGRGVLIGFRSRQYCGGRLHGRVAQAANYVRSRLFETDYSKSIVEILNLWTIKSLEIPLKHRLETSNEHLGHKRQPERKNLTENMTDLSEQEEGEITEMASWIPTTLPRRVPDGQEERLIIPPTISRNIK